jgi:carbamoyl-phosphate synthase large subunit
VNINVLVTGAAGNLAHFMWKALRASGLPLRIVGCNYDVEGAGLFQFDAGYVVPAANHPAYAAQVLELCRQERIHAIFAGSMAEMQVLAEHAGLFREQAGVVVVSSPPDVLRRMGDKWKLTHHLARRGLDFPRSTLPGRTHKYETFLNEVAYPYVVKDRFGAGSQGFGIARDDRQLDHLVTTIPNPVVQEYLHGDDQEYTVGIFVCTNGEPAGSIVMRRHLALGMTMKGEVLPASSLGAYCERVVAHSGCVGPCNVQLRVTERGPVVFEVNPRFSSTTSARAHYGYNEAAMSIRHLVLQEPIVRPVIRPGKFFRVLEDLFVEDAQVEELRSRGCIENAPTTCREACVVTSIEVPERSTSNSGLLDSVTRAGDPYTPPLPHQ